MFVSDAVTNKVELIKALHKKVKEMIKSNNSKVASRVNKGRRELSFNLGDWVWVHFHKDRFLSQKKTKLHPRGMKTFPSY